MNKQNIKIQKINALHLYNIENETLDKIVTDSPWGWVIVGKNQGFIDL